MNIMRPLLVTLEGDLKTLTAFNRAVLFCRGCLSIVNSSRQTMSRVLDFEVVVASSIGDAQFDSVVVVGHDIASLPSAVKELRNLIEAQEAIDKLIKSANKAHLIAAPKSVIPSCRLIFANTGPVLRDYDDVRRFGDAELIAIKRALESGSRKPLLVLPEHSKYENAALVALLSAFHGFYTPLEVREAKPDKAIKVDLVGVLKRDKGDTSSLIRVAECIEAGRVVQRDILASDPIRMSPVRAAEYVESVFNKSDKVKLKIFKDQKEIEKSFPLVAAVNRCVNKIPEFECRVVEYTYEGEGPIQDTLLFVGKGVTLDTGGHDLKTGGHMTGMHRDKGGAATVAGFFKTLTLLKPKHLKVIGVTPFVRNGIGPEAYSTDEIITARSGKRVRIVNTDAEGRMIMVDPLCYVKEKALAEKNPHLFTVATLTGHAVLTWGEGYAALIDNGPARAVGNAEKMRQIGESIGDPFEISSLRREDFDFVEGKSEYEDLEQCNTKPSAQTCRGHMFPCAFLIRGSGLDEHGANDKQPLKYTHIDMAGQDGPFPGVPAANPVAALCAIYILPKI